MISENYFTQDKDIQVIFNHFINWQEVVIAREGADFADAKKYIETQNDLYAFAPGNVEDALEYYRVILESMGELSGKHLSQKAQAMDQQGLKFDQGQVTVPVDTVDLFEKFRDAGVIPYNIQRQYGGLGLPSSVSSILGCVLTRADLAFSMILALLNLAQIIVRYGSTEQSQKYVTKMAKGEYVGAMSLTEPDFGSDLGSVTTKAVKQDDGSYRIFGTKRFISQGCGLADKPCILLTMARTGKPGSGARGLSLFIVKSTDVKISGIEKKLGIHSSPTCEIVYEGSCAELIGKEGFGLIRYTTGMTDFMRLGTATAGAGVGAAAYHEAKKYASEREQFGKSIDKFPAIDRMLRLMRRETNASRLLSIEAGRAVDLYMPAQMRRETSMEKESSIYEKSRIKYWSLVANLYTLLAKYYCTEKSIENANYAIQVHGGAGYTEEYDVARIMRDARILTIYEGTSQIQIIGAIGAITAGMKDTGFLNLYIIDEFKSFSPSDMLIQLYDHLNEAVILFKKIESTIIRDGLAKEVVDITVRFINGMLFERLLSKLSKKDKIDWQNMTNEYHFDSRALCIANLWKLKNS